MNKLTATEVTRYTTLLQQSNLGWKQVEGQWSLNGGPTLTLDSANALHCLVAPDGTLLAPPLDQGAMALYLAGKTDWAEHWFRSRFVESHGWTHISNGCYSNNGPAIPLDEAYVLEVNCMTPGLRETLTMAYLVGAHLTCPVNKPVGVYVLE